MEYRGSSFIVKAFPHVPKQHNASDITRQEEAGMSSRRYRRAVAAATGRGFKSHQPEKIISQTDSEKIDVAVVAAATTEIK